MMSRSVLLVGFRPKHMQLNIYDRVSINHDMLTLLIRVRIRLVVYMAFKTCMSLISYVQAHLCSKVYSHL